MILCSKGQRNLIKREPRYKQKRSLYKNLCLQILVTYIPWRACRWKHRNILITFGKHEEGTSHKTRDSNTFFPQFFFQNLKQKEIRIPRYYRPVSLILISGKIQGLISKQGLFRWKRPGISRN